MNIKEIKEKLQVYDHYDDGTYIYWIYQGYIYYLPRNRYYELKDYFQRCFSKIEDQKRKEQLILENLSISAHILEENPPKITVHYHKGFPVYKIEGELEEFLGRKYSPFPTIQEEKKERNPFLRRVLEYAKKMTRRLRKGLNP